MSSGHLCRLLMRWVINVHARVSRDTALYSTSSCPFLAHTTNWLHWLCYCTVFFLFVCFQFSSIKEACYTAETFRGVSCCEIWCAGNILFPERNTNLQLPTTYDGMQLNFVICSGKVSCFVETSFHGRDIVTFFSFSSLWVWSYKHSQLGWKVSLDVVFLEQHALIFSKYIKHTAFEDT